MSSWRRVARSARTSAGPARMACPGMRSASCWALGPLAADARVSVAGYAFGYTVSPRSASTWFDPPVFLWTCPAFGQRIRDRGPVIMLAADEAGHADGCGRLTAGRSGMSTGPRHATAPPPSHTASSRLPPAAPLPGPRGRDAPGGRRLSRRSRSCWESFDSRQAGYGDRLQMIICPSGRQGTHSSPAARRRTHANPACPADQDVLWPAGAI
jgi:hypothetical protein